MAHQNLVYRYCSACLPCPPFYNNNIIIYILRVYFYCILKSIIYIDNKYYKYFIIHGHNNTIDPVDMLAARIDTISNTIIIRLPIIGLYWTHFRELNIYVIDTADSRNHLNQRFRSMQLLPVLCHQPWHIPYHLRTPLDSSDACACLSTCWPPRPRPSRAQGGQVWQGPGGGAAQRRSRRRSMRGAY